MEQIALEKITAWEAAGKLAPHPQLVTILYSWKRLMPEDGEELAVFINKLEATTEGLLIFVTVFLRQSTSQTMGDSVSRRNWRIDPKNIADFTDIEAVTARLRDVRRSVAFSELEERQKIAVKLYLDTVDGKVEEW